MIVADKDVSLVLTGTGDVLEPEAGVMAIGSGGNYALAAARALVDTDKDAETIVRRALEEPLRQIVGNAGEEGAVIVGKINDNDNAHYGYNAGTNKFEDLVAAGVIDPTKVTRTALQNAASIAGLMLTTEAMVADIPEPKPSAPAGGHGGGGMGDMY